MTAPAESVEFRAVAAGVRPLVRVSAGGVNYEQRHANWLSWTIVILSGGLAFLVWPKLQFGSRSVTIPRSMIQSVAVDRGMSYASLVVRSTADTVKFRTDVSTAEQARNILLS